VSIKKYRAKNILEKKGSLGTVFLPVSIKKVGRGILKKKRARDNAKRCGGDWHSLSLLVFLKKIRARDFAKRRHSLSLLLLTL
jgi:hypothetical protein